MFSSTDVWMTFKSGKLAVVKVDDAERRMAECQFVVEPFPFGLASEMGDAVASHVFTDEGALRSELSSVTLDPRVPMQRMFARGAEGVDPTRIDDVDILKMVCSHQVDEKTGKEWIKATVHVRFDFAPNSHREWIAMYFGYGFYATFEVVQENLLDDDDEVDAFEERASKRGVADAVRRMQNLAGEQGGSMEIIGPDGDGVRLTKDSVERIQGKAL